VQFKLQKKVCGLWGCDWRNVKTTSAMAVPNAGTYKYPLSAPCSPGGHWYRMAYRVVWAKFVGDAIESSVDEGNSLRSNYSC
jgi:hypothetical protein